MTHWQNNSPDLKFVKNCSYKRLPSLRQMCLKPHAWSLQANVIKLESTQIWRRSKVVRFELTQVWRHLFAVHTCLLWLLWLVIMFLVPDKPYVGIITVVVNLNLDGAVAKCCDGRQNWVNGRQIWVTSDSKLNCDGYTRFIERTCIVYRDGTKLEASLWEDAIPSIFPRATALKIQTRNQLSCRTNYVKCSCFKKKIATNNVFARLLRLRTKSEQRLKQKRVLNAEYLVARNICSSSDCFKFSLPTVFLRIGVCWTFSRALPSEISLRKWLYT